MYTSLIAFVLLSAVYASPAAATAPPLPNLVGANKLITPRSDINKCLTAASNTNGAAVELEDCVSGDQNQVWNITGSTITIFGGSKCVDDTNGNRNNGQPLQIWECAEGNTNQMWESIGFTFQLQESAKCLDNTNGSDDNGNKAQIWECTGGSNQKWATQDAAPPISLNNITLQPLKSNGTCLTAFKNADSAAVEVEPCNGSDAQSWTITDGKVTVFGDKCLDVNNGNTANGVKMQIFTCFEGNTNQQWTFTVPSGVGVNSTVLHWANHNECLDLTNGDISPGNQVQVWECFTGNTNQIWTIVPA